MGLQKEKFSYLKGRKIDLVHLENLRKTMILRINQIFHFWLRLIWVFQNMMSNPMEAQFEKTADNKATKVLKSYFELQWKLTASIKTKKVFSLLKNKFRFKPAKNQFLSFNSKNCRMTTNFHMIHRKQKTMAISSVSLLTTPVKRKFTKMYQLQSFYSSTDKIRTRRNFLSASQTASLKK